MTYRTGRPYKLNDSQRDLLARVKALRKAIPTDVELAKAFNCSPGCINQSLRNIWTKRREKA